MLQNAGSILGFITRSFSVKQWKELKGLGLFNVEKKKLEGSHDDCFSSKSSIATERKKRNNWLNLQESRFWLVIRKNYLAT